MTTSKQPTGVADRSYTVVTCHFGDPFWITHSLSQLDRCSDGRVASIVVVDQTRSSAAFLTRLPRVSRVLAFPVDQGEVDFLGHDHAASLNRALRSIEFSTSHVLVMDSDCFPIDASWLDRLGDVTVAGDPQKLGLSHPCLMAFPREFAGAIDCAEGLREVFIDTGRLVALQLARAGAAVAFTRPRRAFRGLRGDFYLDGAVYHHGSASFISSGDDRLRRQVSAEAEEFYRRLVVQGRHDLTAWQYVCRRVRDRLADIRRRG
jgi:hypothetical protein